MTPENAANAVAQPTELTPENAAVLAAYAGHLEHSPLSGHSPRTYLARDEDRYRILSVT